MTEKRIKKVIKNLLPLAVIEFIQLQKSMSDWRKIDFLENSPQIVKQKVFINME